MNVSETFYYYYYLILANQEFQHFCLAEIPNHFPTFGHPNPNQFPTTFCGKVEHVPKFSLSVQGFMQDF